MFVTVGLVNGIQQIFGRSAEDPSTSLSDPDTFLTMLKGKKTDAGVEVTPENSRGLAAVFAADRIICDAISTMPVKVFRKSGEKSQEATDHPVYRLVHERPNAFMTASTFYEVGQRWLNLHGNFLAVIKFNNLARPTSMLPVEWNRVKVTVTKDRILYTIKMFDGKDDVTLDHTNVIHIPAFSKDGIHGISPIEKARETFATGKAAQKFGNKFFGSGGNVSNVIETDEALSDENFARFKEEWQQFEGIDNAHGTPVLDAGMKFRSVNIAPDQAQFIETQKLSKQDVASIFSVNPVLIGDSEGTNRANADTLTLNFTKFTLSPWTVKWRQELQRKLLFDRELKEGDLSIEFIMDSLLRADPLTRAKFAKIMHGQGIFTADEIREKENKNPTGGKSAEQLFPTNNQDPEGNIDSNNQEDE